LFLKTVELKSDVDRAVGVGTALLAASIPDGVIGIFLRHNSSVLTVTLGSTQLLTEMSNRNISWGYSRLMCRADSIATFIC